MLGSTCNATIRVGIETAIVGTGIDGIGGIEIATAETGGTTNHWTNAGFCWLRCGIT